MHAWEGTHAELFADLPGCRAVLPRGPSLPSARAWSHCPLPLATCRNGRRRTERLGLSGAGRGVAGSDYSGPKWSSEYGTPEQRSRELQGSALFSSDSSGQIERVACQHCSGLQRTELPWRIPQCSRLSTHRHVISARGYICVTYRVEEGQWRHLRFILP